MKYNMISVLLGTWQHFNSYERLLGSPLKVIGRCLGNQTKSTFSNDLFYRHVFSRNLTGACVWIKRSVLADLFIAEWTGICCHLWTSSVIQCHVMALRRFRQFYWNLRKKIVFNFIKYTSITWMTYFTVSRNNHLYSLWIITSGFG